MYDKINGKWFNRLAGYKLLAGYCVNKAGETVRVFTVDGKLVASQRINGEGTADIDLTTLGKGLYIVKSAKTSIKVMNK